MATRIAKTAAQDCLNDIVDRLDVGGGGTLLIYTGSQPANPDDVPSGTLLATLTLSTTAFGAATQTSNGATVAANAITPATAVAAGIAGSARLASNDGTV